MAGPITWRNVAPSADANTAAQLLLASQRSINNALDPLQKIVQDQSAFGAQQAATVREGNKQAFLDALAGAKTPEQLEALRTSGNLDALRSKLTPEGLAAVRGADEARLTGLRQQVVAGQQFDETQIARSERPKLDHYASLVAQGKHAEAEQFLTDNQLTQEAPLYSALATAKRDKTIRERADQEYAWKVGQHGRTEKIDELKLKEAERLSAEGATIREGDAWANKFATAYQNQIAAGRKGIDAELVKMGTTLPRNADGSVNVGAMPPDQLGILDKHLKVMGLPALSEVYSGETAALARARDELRASGRKPTEIARLEALLPSLLNTSPLSPIGADATKAAGIEAARKVAYDRQDVNNAWYAPGSDDARNSYDVLSKEVTEYLKTLPGSFSNGFSPDEDNKAIQDMLGRFATEGVKVKIKGEGGEKAQTVSVVPSANDVRRFLRTSEGSIWHDGNRAADIEDNLKKWMQSSAGQAMIKSGLESQAFRDSESIKQFQRDRLNPPKK